MRRLTKVADAPSAPAQIPTETCKRRGFRARHRPPSAPSAAGAPSSDGATSPDERLRPVIDRAFAEPDPERPRHTRAVVIVHDGRVVGQRYANGFTNETPILGWSMTKTMINALVGVLVKQGRLALDRPAPIP